MAIRSAGAAPTDFAKLRELSDALFDQLDSLQKEAAHRQVIINTVNEAEKVKSDAQAYAESVRVTADKVRSEANDLKALADGELAKATELRNAAVAYEAELKAKLAAADKADADARKAQDNRAAHLDAKSNQLDVREAKLNSFETSLNARQKALNDRLDSLRAVAV